MINHKESASNFSPEEKNLQYFAKNKQVEAYIREIDSRRKNGVQISNHARKTYDHFTSIISKAQEMSKIFKTPLQGWKINKINQKSQLAVRVTGTHIELRYEGSFDTNIENLCIMIYQITLYNHWVPFCTFSQNLKDVSPLEKICFLRFKMPFLTERYSFFHGMGIDRIEENGSIMIYAEGISENENFLKQFDIDKKEKNIDKLVLLDLKFFVVEIMPLQNGQFSFSAYGSLDSHMPILPSWLLNTIIKQMGGFIFDRIVKQSKEFEGSKWEQQMKKQSNDMFYGWLHQRISFWKEKVKGKVKGKM